VKIREKLAGKKVVLIMSGGNLDRAHLELALSHDSSRSSMDSK